MRSTIKSWAVLLPWVTMSLCMSALAGCATHPAPASRNDALSAVSCLSADSCVAVGTEDTITGRSSEGWLSGTDAPMATRWDGSRWHKLAVRLPSGANYGTLASVSCKPGGCLAVGFYSTPPDTDTFALAEYWNDSTWTPVTLALPPGSGDRSLSAVSCVSARQCIATGDHEGANSGLDLPLATWDGHQWSWSRQPVLAGAWDSVDLKSISCVTARYCVAVGRALNYSRNIGGAISFTETWNGQGWTYAPAPLATADAVSLSCPAASHCVAVGVDTQFAGFGQLLDGAHWAQPAMPWPRGGTQSSLYGVSCAAKTCLAVGATGPSQAPDITASQPAALAWNGATWTWQAIPGRTSGILYGVTCVTAADCVAVGSARDGNTTRNLAEFWNGTAWTISHPA